SITISGTPTTSGTFPINIRYRDKNSCFSSVTYNLTIIAAGSVSISGKVTNGGQGLSNATVTLSGGANRTATTDAAGNYTITNLSSNQDYTATVTSAGYVFAQPTRTFTALNANVSNGDFATAFVNYEGDTMPRNTGDGAVNVVDFIRVRRIVDNLEPLATNGGDFQRTSVAPRSQLGSRTISRNDTDQILRYILALDPLTLVGGPSQAATNALNTNLKTFDKSRVSINLQTLPVDMTETNSLLAAAPIGISAATVLASNGSATVPVTLNLDGTATAVQFTKTYDSSKLNLTSVTNSQNTFNEIFFNTSIPGKVTVVALRRAGVQNGFLTGELNRLNFSVLESATGRAVIDFNNTPTERIAADSSANPINVNSSPEIVTTTAAVVTISGELLTTKGKGISRARVSLTMPSGETRTTISNLLGFYRFQDIAAGETCVFSVTHKRYVFTT
ncbi:MAG: carboxypeptidase regulatory-like domain-containing protein, partial [Pyrinomonadaceae bacterium]|nr:carboxypeptidase regulatory-like domain-containing protein [Pyrinomonadaceae bacterium]